MNIYVNCPECGKESMSIKSYLMPRWLLFIGIFAQYQMVHYTCCPKCMRKHILIHGFTYNILTGNILWLIMGLPWYIVVLIMSFTKGHSKSVQKIINKKINNVEDL